jgi:hypothetical protein
MVALSDQAKKYKITRAFKIIEIQSCYDFQQVETLLAIVCSFLHKHSNMNSANTLIIFHPCTH